LVCDTNINSSSVDQCVQCAMIGNTSVGCDAGEVCSPALVDGNEWQGNDQCEPDCRLTDAGICAPGFCETDSGICYSQTQVVNFCGVSPIVSVTGWCLSGADCQVNGEGACNLASNLCPFNPNFCFPVTSFGYCVPCTVDGGGCPAGLFCQQNVCSDGPAGVCVPDCFTAGGCDAGTFCADAGIASADGGPDGGPLIVGACTPGCQNVSNCVGLVADPICSGSQCVQCAKQGDCGDWEPGCVGNICNSCVNSSDCPGSLQCETIVCGLGSGASRCECRTANDCQSDVPVCVGESDGGNATGQCACTDSSQCLAGAVCETRYPYAVVNGCGAVLGGACIAACTSATDCVTLMGGTGNAGCDTTTGYCVPCATDQDCSANANPNQPALTPSCVLFPDGGYPNVTPPLLTGGGSCGCSDVSQCNAGYTCINPGPTGQCGPACTFANGVDSCLLPSDIQNGCPGTFGSNVTPYCNTYTGTCQGCLDDYDCTSLYCNTPICQTDGGFCFQCYSGDDCTAFPDYACQGGLCGTVCSSAAQCPSDGGFDCISVFGQSKCLITCVMGDDAGLGTVSDAGNPCPADSPLCLTGGSNLDAGLGYCTQCDTGGRSGDQYCDAGHCPNGFGSAFCNLPQCNVFCFIIADPKGAP
jgi:hypothetical protein